MLINASIDVSLLEEMFKKRHSSFNRSSKNQRMYVNLSIWVNDEPDKFGDHASIQLNSSKDGLENDRKINPPKKDGSPSDRCYIGRGKKADFGAQPLNQSDTLSFGGSPTTGQQPQDNSQAWNQPNTGLPF
jgi:hypothetical protein